MRDIKFRAKRTDNGEWVYGSPYKQGGITLMMHSPGGRMELVVVDESTIGQFTGLHDNNKEEVCEGDLLKHIHDDVLLPWVVVEKNGCFGIRNVGQDGYTNFEEFWTCNSIYFFSDRKIVGNIHDNQVSSEETKES